MEQPVRYCAPTKYDLAPYKTVAKVHKDNGYDFYIQLSHNQEDPKWERMGNMLEIAFSSEFDRSDFIDEAMVWYENETNTAVDRP